MLEGLASKSCRKTEKLTEVEMSATKIDQKWELITLNFVNDLFRQHKSFFLREAITP